MDDELKSIIARRNWSKLRESSKAAKIAEETFEAKDDAVIIEGRTREKANGKKKRVLLALYDVEVCGYAKDYPNVRALSDVIAKITAQKPATVLSDMKLFYDKTLIGPSGSETYSFTLRGSYCLTGMGKALAEYFKAEERDGKK
jgi:hypothetical protein